jgi:hypothetical protein
VCWAFGIVPSEFEELSWRVSFTDIRFQLNIQLSLEQMRGIQTFQAVAEVLAAAFGGKKNSSSSIPQVDERFVPKSGAEAEMMFRSLPGCG